MITLTGTDPADLDADTSTPNTDDAAERTALTKAAALLAKHLGGDVTIHAAGTSFDGETTGTLTVTVSRR